SPALLLIVTVLIVPLVIGISYSFRKFTAFHSEFVGLGQYRAMLTDDVLRDALINTAWWTLGSLALQFFLRLGLARPLNRPLHRRKVVQGLVSLPWAVPISLPGLTWSCLFNPLMAPLPHWFSAIGLQPGPLPIRATPEPAMWGPTTANVWFGIP